MPTFGSLESGWSQVPSVQTMMFLGMGFFFLNNQLPDHSGNVGILQGFSGWVKNSLAPFRVSRFRIVVDPEYPTERSSVTNFRHT